MSPLTIGTSAPTYRGLVSGSGVSGAGGDVAHVSNPGVGGGGVLVFKGINTKSNRNGGSGGSEALGGEIEALVDQEGLVRESLSGGSTFTESQSKRAST